MDVSERGSERGGGAVAIISESGGEWPECGRSWRIEMEAIEYDYAGGSDIAWS